MSDGKESSMANRQFSCVQESSKSNLPEVTIAVVGEDDAGKTSFIKSALDMKGTPSSVSTKKKMSLDGSVYIVRLLEIDLKQVTFDQDLNIVWPRVGRDSADLIVDGVLLLHDATQPERLERTVELAGMCLGLCLCPKHSIWDSFSSYPC
jgi:ABC-type dipeptide/oligopeptide/nickel transport system ATPase component